MTATQTLFVYGTLCHAPLLAAVLGRDPGNGVPARLEGWRAGLIRGETYPAIAPDPSAFAEGLLFTGLRERDIARLDFYELGAGYERARRRVQGPHGPVEALVYLAGETQTLEGDWVLASWAEAHGETALLAAEDFMALMGRMPPEAAMARFGQILVRASSTLRARATLAPATIRSAFEAGQVEIEGASRPYTEYFALREHVLRFPMFGGAMSGPVRRAGFMLGDAVTVLPWDPVRDRVLLVEQFRYGPYLRGDPRPWSLEPIAGRIDPGEAPESSARREAREEAGLELGALHRIGAYYPSPGAVTEWLVSYVGIADLPDGAGVVAGVAHEAEDIKGHVIPFQRLLELLETGEAANAPLILSALWLAAQKDRLVREMA